MAKLAKKQKPVQKTANARKWRPVLLLSIKIVAVCGLLIAILACLAWLFDADKPAPKVYGTARLSDKQLQSLSEQDRYQNLDLRVASLAVYKGAPLRIEQNLGVIGGVRQSVINFPVYSAGLVEKGLMTLPTSPPPASGYPALILCHGYVDPRRYSTNQAYLPQMEYFSRHGFAVVKPDFRGNGLSKNIGKPEGAYYSMAYNVDFLSLLASLEETSYINKSNISAWGHSMGAYIALRAAILAPQIKNVVLLSGPVGSTQDMFTSYLAPSDRSNPVAFLIRSTKLSQNGTPLSNPSFWNNTSPLNYLAQSKANFQIHVGALDRTAPPKFSAELDAALTKAHVPHQYFLYENGNHGLGADMPVVLSRSLGLLQNTN